MIYGEIEGNPKWKRINMRNVEHLIAVEFIHDLYNRHEPKINSIRFRHTITTWKDGVLNSYAPENEWQKLGEVLGYQYYSLDPILIKYTNALYCRKREHFHSFNKELQKTKFSTLPAKELASLLIHFQSIVLGELYVLNFVQVEHGLNIAIKNILNEVVSDKFDIENIFIKIIQTKKHSASQQEKTQLHFIAFKYRLLKKISLYNDDRARKEVQKHCDTYQYLYSAYGETPRTFNDFWLEFRTYLEGKKWLPSTSISSNLLSNEANRTLKKLKSKKLSVLVPLLVKGGLFRDTNKALLGMSTKYRFSILDEIAKRNFEDRKNLDFYLLEEIVDLLYSFKKVSQEKINLRKTNGIIITRNEDFHIHTPELAPQLNSDEEYKKVLYGQCASQGISIGKCKIVLRKEDITKIEQGDIMVAVGTDFDLIESMYRSSAVITEEGGILSHAAIVCRELNKPCIIGVKNATQLFRDGLVIRVDATKAEITIL